MACCAHCGADPDAVVIPASLVRWYDAQNDRVLQIGYDGKFKSVQMFIGQQELERAKPTGDLRASLEELGCRVVEDAYILIGLPPPASAAAE